MWKGLPRGVCPLQKGLPRGVCPLLKGLDKGCLPSAEGSGQGCSRDVCLLYCAVRHLIILFELTPVASCKEITSVQHPVGKGFLICLGGWCHSVS